MLTEREQSVVKKSKRRGFGAYLQWAWLEYPELQDDIRRKVFPPRKRLRTANAAMDSQRISFDICYLSSLPAEEINPLQVEQEAWKLLSPQIKQYIGQFGIYIATYSPQTAEQEQLLGHVDTGWDFIQQWYVVSQSYKAKCEQNWKKVGKRETAVKGLIQALRKR